MVITPTGQRSNHDILPAISNFSVVISVIQANAQANALSIFRRQAGMDFRIGGDDGLHGFQTRKGDCLYRLCSMLPNDMAQFYFQVVRGRAIRRFSHSFLFRRTHCSTAADIAIARVAARHVGRSRRPPVDLQAPTPNHPCGSLWTPRRCHN